MLGQKVNPKHVLPKWWLVMVMFIPWYNPEKKNNQTIQVLEPQYNAEDVTGYPPIMLWQSDRICKVCHIFAISNMEFFQDFFRVCQFHAKCCMYIWNIYLNMYHTFKPNVREYSIHGSSTTKKTSESMKLAQNVQDQNWTERTPFSWDPYNYGLLKNPHITL